MILVAGLMWSLGGVFVKILTLHYDVDPKAIAFLRSAIVGVLLAWALPGVRWAPKGRLAVAGIAYTVVVGTFVVATAGTTAANAICLQYAYPLFVAIGAVVIFKEALGGRTVAAVALGTAGVAMILVFSWSGASYVGLTSGLISAIALATFTLLQRSVKAANPVGLSSLCNLTAAALLFPLAWGHLDVSFEALLVAAAMGTFQLGLPYVLFIKGLRLVPATDGALITLVEPVLNPVWVWLVVAEAPHWSTLIGGGLILIALLVRFLGARKAV
jgi:drug/metabolite transporter (DMT)-like permease